MRIPLLDTLGSRLLDSSLPFLPYFLSVIFFGWNALALVLLGGPVEKMSFFQMAPGSILSTQIPSDRSQYDVYKFLFKKIGWKVSVGGVKADIFAH